MTRELIVKAHSFRGTPKIPGDKSISHRGLIFGAMAKGRSEVLDILDSADVQSTARCLRALGVSISELGPKTIIESAGAAGFKSPAGILDCGNSGTTIRLLMGVLAGQNLSATLTGDASIQKRPMKRVAQPLEAMGAHFELSNSNYAPLKVVGTNLHGIDYKLPVASAQIKTAIILAALSAEGETRIHGEIQSRDHTERLLSHYGATLRADEKEIVVPGRQQLKPASLQVPGDPSTAAFWMAAASLIPGGDVEMKNISLNPTRIGFLRVLQRMGANIEIETTMQGAEPVGRIRVRRKELKAFVVSAEEVPFLIDEVPLLAVLATQAVGESRVEGAEELRVKESDRLESVATNLRAMGVKLEVLPDGFKIAGPQPLMGAEIQTFHDHRIAMAFAIAGLLAQGQTTILDAECAGVSYPEFFNTLRELTRNG